MLRQEAKYFRHKKKECLKDKIENLKLTVKTKNIRDLYRGISDFKKGYRPRMNRVKEEKYPLVADYTEFRLGGGIVSLSSLNIHGFNDVRQTEIQTAEPLGPESIAFEVEKANEKLKRHTLQDTDQHPAE